MKYELWDMVSYGYGEPLMPFTKVASNKDFSTIYQMYLDEVSRRRPCVIIVSPQEKYTKERADV